MVVMMLGTNCGHRTESFSGTGDALLEQGGKMVLIFESMADLGTYRHVHTPHCLVLVHAHNQTNHQLTPSESHRLDTWFVPLLILMLEHRQTLWLRVVDVDKATTGLDYSMWTKWNTRPVPGLIEMD